ncbi:MAG TPA: protein kinase [Oculatellaceae cyanobacterium]|jgi:serine/threonine-protein kinase
MVEKTLRDRYQIIQHLGSRRFCEIYLAKDEDLPGKPVCVIKQLKPKNLDPLLWSTAKRFFKTEAEALYQLGKHDKIPQLLAQFEEGANSYIVQEFIEGNELSKELIPGQQWSEKQVIFFCCEVLEILDFIHQQHIIHRDIKPSNLIRRKKDNKITLIDFGAVKQKNPDFGISVDPGGLTVAIGTQGYMPPEQANGNPQYNSDIYALGVICIQALTGVSPQKDNSTNELIWQNQVKISPQFANVLNKIVHTDYNQRYQSAAEALQAIQNLSPIEISKSDNKLSFIKILPIILLTVSLLTFVSTLLFTQWRLTEINKNINNPTSTELPLAKSNNFLNYENVNAGIKIKYPENWQKQDVENPFTGEVVLFTSQFSNQINKFEPKISIRIEELSGQPISLENYTNLSIKEIQKYLLNSDITDSSSTTLGGIPAHRVVYNGVEGDSRLIKHLEVWAVFNQKAYIVSYTATPEEYPNNLESIEKMINSFEIF